MIENLWRAMAERDLGSLVAILNDVRGENMNKMETFEAGAERGYQRSLEDREKSAFYVRRQKLVEELKAGLGALLDKLDTAEEEAPLSNRLQTVQRKILDAIIEL